MLAVIVSRAVGGVIGGVARLCYGARLGASRVLTPGERWGASGHRKGNKIVTPPPPKKKKEEDSNLFFFFLFSLFRVCLFLSFFLSSFACFCLFFLFFFFKVQKALCCPRETFFGPTIHCKGKTAAKSGVGGGGKGERTMQRGHSCQFGPRPQRPGLRQSSLHTPPPPSNHGHGGP